MVDVHDEELAAARRAWRDGTFAGLYRQFRPMVERSIAWLVADGHRRVRYLGVEANRLSLSLRIGTLNLRWLVNLGLDHRTGWVLGRKPANTTLEPIHRGLPPMDLRMTGREPTRGPTS